MSTLQKVRLKVSRIVEGGLKPSCHFILEEEGISIVVARTHPGLTEQKQTDQKVTAVSNEQQFVSRLPCISQKVGNYIALSLLIQKRINDIYNSYTWMSISYNYIFDMGITMG